MKPIKTALYLSITSALLFGCASESTTPSDQTKPTFYSCDASNISAANDLRIYQVMVESFVNGDDSIGHGTGYGTSHHMGDIQGIIDSLDYIQSLGMNGLWLTPIFNSQPIGGQDHWADRLDATGYFATNYFEIDPRFGTLEDAKRLVDEAHARGMYVFFDGVFGHHKSNVVPSPSGLTPVGSDNPVSYPESLPFYKEVAEYWIKELKIDGWRLDQAYQVPTDAWQEIRKAVDEASNSVTYADKDGKQVNPLGYMVAEIWAGENKIIETGYGTDSAPALCSAFDFPVRYRLVETFAVNESGVGGKGGEWLAEGMSLHSLYPDHAKPNLMLGNHDLVRFGDLIQRGNLADPEDNEYWQRYKAVLSFQAAYTGPITAYYGDEIGDELEGFASRIENDCAIIGKCDDHVARTSGVVEGVNATLDPKQADLKTYFTELMTLREQHPALARGARTNIIANATTYADVKQYEGNAILYVLNVSDNTQQISIANETLASNTTLTDLQSNERISLTSGHYSIGLAPFQGRFLNIDQPSGAAPIALVAAASQATGDSFMGACDNPTVSESGPINESLYVVGDFTDSNWKHSSSRAFEYKGDGVYQVVVSEKPGSYRMQYATKDWKPQFTAEGLSLKLGQENTLKFGGYGKDTAVTILEEGRYVWSLKFDDAGTPLNILAAKCAQ
ncbi:glycosidase [Vibrio sp. 10N.286.49.C2]|uniref:alpha-amylase family glycosyl hydrolase n=1 Tax=unclassified Vibrio TaxID=2614977 RepID=UPI000C831CA9|nr:MULTISPECIES: alpha-amylase family glycosyl hydrolase [unclassified Vibrio]PMH31593.1 glycosidase [Vibrio sp. 10N.286.49.C2]PMH50615.1 glycosidase [Vibrio sp. 10N.286.49.B1]PMH82815.1 glycosidase [Vibrio sp. 10N.286.48.B7]